MHTIKSQITKPCTGKYITGKDIIFPLHKSISIESDSILFNGNKFGEIDENARTITVDRKLAIDSRSGINLFLSHTSLATNSTYIVNDAENTHVFYTDAKGRVERTEHKVKEIFLQRKNTEQTKALMCKEEDMAPYNLFAGTGKRAPIQIRDEGGHILADSIGGIPEAINIFPQAFAINHSSEWRGMETTIKKAIEQSKIVEVKTKFDYSGNDKRTSSFSYLVSINGAITKYYFKNINATLDS